MLTNSSLNLEMVGGRRLEDDAFDGRSKTSSRRPVNLRQLVTEKSR